MSTKTIFISSLLVLFMSSCVNLNKIYNDDHQTVSLNIPASIQNIDFFDRREKVSQGEIPLPVISMPDQFIAHYPNFDPSHRKLITDLLYGNFEPIENRSFTIIVELLEGTQEFSANFWKETERVKVKLRITLKNEKEQYSSEIKGEYFVSSADAKYKRIEEMYQRALLNVAFNSLLEIKNTAFKNSTVEFHE